MGLPVITSPGLGPAAEKVHDFPSCTRATGVVGLILVGIGKFAIVLLQDIWPTLRPASLHGLSREAVIGGIVVLVVVVRLGLVVVMGARVLVIMIAVVGFGREDTEVILSLVETRPKLGELLVDLSFIAEWLIWVCWFPIMVDLV